MQLSAIVRKLIQCVAAARRRQRDLRTLRGLNPHMLKDIGLRREGSEIVPLFPAHSVDASGVNDKPESAVALRLVEAGQSVEIEESAADKKEGSIQVCRYCGEKLA
ncbi:MULTISPECIES: DUF1127 domain-containing protein [Salinicola]|uniref:YjiS-like domain-containing protein n=1 Tax=Salinicola socius TaxID=404433 RepID=A0A1Q8SV66_9GAMM|nr:MULTISPECIES: DUF1127 domain-containing protein [Salinicola]OLO05344.1 hypothetical protein BTW07_04780 [Salinicola socius]